MSRWHLREFKKSEEGAVAMAVAFSIIIVVAVVGMAIDLGRLYVVESRLQYAIDAASLATGKDLKEFINSGQSNEALEAHASAHFNLNFPEGYLGSSVTRFQVQTRGGNPPNEVVVTADANVPMIFADYIAGLGDDETRFGNLQVTQSAQTYRRSEGGVELVMAVDVSGSMGDPAPGGNGTRLTALKSAAMSLVDILMGDQSDNTSGNVQIGLAPWTGGINIGESNSDWLKQSPPSNWNGCIFVRSADKSAEITGKINSPGALNDDPPFGSDRFIPTVHDGIAGCPPKITPLTAQRDTIEDAIESLEAFGATSTHLGTVWGWRMLSPKWQGIWPDVQDNHPTDYDDSIFNKAIVLMTDGENDILHLCNGYYQPWRTRCYYNSWGGRHYYAADNISAYTRAFHSRAVSESEVNRLTRRTCDKIKSLGITIYSISFGPVNSEEPLLYCASGEEKYFRSPTADDLKTAFKTIAADLSQLYLQR